MTIETASAAFLNKKSEFIKNLVFPLANRIDDCVSALEYSEEKQNGEEYCIITFNSGYKKKYVYQQTVKRLLSLIFSKLFELKSYI